jgi:acyl-CoA synthetase (AMP-forming)/AMP-acid ligase II
MTCTPELQYHKRPDATKDSIVEGGWFRTGDIAKFDEDHYCYITDRIKELVGLSVSVFSPELFVLSFSLSL